MSHVASQLSSWAVLVTIHKVDSYAPPLTRPSEICTSTHQISMDGDQGVKVLGGCSLGHARRIVRSVLKDPGRACHPSMRASMAACGISGGSAQEAKRKIEITRLRKNIVRRDGFMSA